MPACVTKSPGPASTVHTRSPCPRQQVQQPVTNGCSASTDCTAPRDVKHRVSNPSGTALGPHSGCASPVAGKQGGYTAIHSNSSHWGHQLPPIGQHSHYHHAAAYPAAVYQKLGKHSYSLWHSTAERLRQQRVLHLMRQLAVWATVGVLGFLLLSSLAPTPQQQAAPSTDVLLSLGPYFFNPSIVRHRGVYLSTARTAHMKRIDRTNWWFNEGYVCMSTTADFKTVSCRKFDPWQGRFQECLWGSERKVADVDTQGVEDPKLFVWPGKGVYAVFGRKPEALGASPYCRDPIFVQFLVQVVAENAGDAWSIHRPTELKPGIFAPQLYTNRKSREPIKEKNWMPFVWQEQLFMVHSVFPQRVFRVNSSGVAVQQFVTTSPKLFEPYKNEDVHGGPPLIHVPGHLSGLGRDYFLGIFHFFKTFGEGVHKVKVYHHYAYYVEAAPPFRVCGVSREIPLVTRKKQENKKASDWTHQRIWKDTSQTSYIAGMYLDNNRVLISYGSSDIDARLLSMSVAEVEGMFDQPFDCSQSEVLDNGSGEPMPLIGSSSATAEVAGTAVRAQQQVQSHAADVNAALLRDVVKTARTGLPPNGSTARAAVSMQAVSQLESGTVARAAYHHQQHNTRQEHRSHPRHLRQLQH